MLSCLFLLIQYQTLIAPQNYIRQAPPTAGFWHFCLVTTPFLSPHGAHYSYGLALPCTGESRPLARPSSHSPKDPKHIIQFFNALREKELNGRGSYKLALRDT